MTVVIYPSAIKTDREKLFACYSLIEQLRLEYNKVSAIAASDKDAYKGKFRAYADKVKDYLKQLHAERNSLIEKIRWANYTLEDWKQVSKLSIEEQDAIHKSLFGDRQVECVKPTLATSPLLDDLKATSLDDMPSKLGNDPVEDFTTYTEVDEGSDITKDANTITFTSAETRLYTEHVYNDKGADHFAGNFEHLLELYVSASNSYSLFGSWVLANAIGDLRDLELASANSFWLYWYCSASAVKSLTLYEQDGASGYSDGSVALSLTTIYFLEIERDEGVGTYGTLYARICTGNYYGLGGSLVDTLSITLHTSKKDFRYIYGFSSYDTDSDAGVTSTGYVEDLDLQEVTPSIPFRNYYSHILAH